MRRRRNSAIFVAVVLVAAACGGNSDSSSTEDSGPRQTPATQVADSGNTDPGDTEAEDTPSEETGPGDTSTSSGAITVDSAGSATSAVSPTTMPVRKAPLTGLAGEDPSLASRPAMVVKIDGHLQARPQFGLDEADIVIEEIVEGITRFMAVFHSRIPEVVGPIRSARTQDMLIVPMLDNPLFVWSGGNTKVTAVVRKGPVVNISATNGWRLKGVWFRTKKRRGPHNLLANSDAVLALAPEGATAPRPLFFYRSAGEEVGGIAVHGARITMSGTRVQWEWNPSLRLWERTSEGKAHTAESGNRITAANVVVLEVKYKPSPADPNSPEGQTKGSGKALVFTDGRLVLGTWKRASGPDPWTLLDEQGQAIRLTPGQTWVELAKAGRTAVIEVGVNPKDVRWKQA